MGESVNDCAFSPSNMSPSTVQVVFFTFTSTLFLIRRAATEVDNIEYEVYFDQLVIIQMCCYDKNPAFIKRNSHSLVFKVINW